MSDLMKPFGVRFLAVFVLEQRAAFVEQLNNHLASIHPKSRSKVTKRLAKEIEDGSPPLAQSVDDLRAFAEQLDTRVAEYFEELDEDVQLLVSGILRLDQIILTLALGDRQHIAACFAHEAEMWRDSIKRISNIRRMDGWIERAERAARFFELIAEDYKNGKK